MCAFEGIAARLKVVILICIVWRPSEVFARAELSEDVLAPCKDATVGEQRQGVEKACRDVHDVLIKEARNDRGGNLDRPAAVSDLGVILKWTDALAHLA